MEKIKITNKRETNHLSNEEKKQEGENMEHEIKEQEQKAEEEIEVIRGEEKSKVGRIWKIRNKVLGKGKHKTEATAIMNPKTNQLVVSKHEIKEVVLKYCKDTLNNNEPEEEYKEGIDEKTREMKNKLEEKDGEFEVTQETFEKVVEKFRKSRKLNYQPLVRASKCYQQSMFKLCQRMIKQEKFPRTFKETTLHMLFKGGNGRREVLSDNRFIHSKSWLPRLAEALVVEEGMKGPLVGQSTMYQVGGQPGHRAEELMFVIKSIIGKYRKEGKPIIIQAWDISKYFDKEMMEDAILTCYKRKVNPKATRLWYNLNKNTNIKVKTGVGITEATDVGAVVGQGTVGGALVSQAVLDEGVKNEFQPGNKDETNYGEVPMGPCMFMDDLIHCSTGLEEAKKASKKINEVMKKHALKLNESKSVAIVMGSKKQTKEIMEKIKDSPIKCGEVEIKAKEKDKWLGQQLAAGGLSDSVAATVAAREAKVKGAAMEIVSIVKDWRTRVVGGMESALVLWEACVIPTLLHGAGTWTNMRVGTVDKMNSLQMWFLRMVLEVGPGAPLAALRWDTGLIDMKLRVWKEKIMMIIHLRRLAETSLASKVYNEQKAKGWPGLSEETKNICQHLGIEDCNETKMDLKEFKKIVNDAIKKEDEALIKAQAVGKTKCARVFVEKYGKKEYFKEQKISETREWFKSRFALQKFAGNYSKDKRFAKTNWLCRCGEREEEVHLARCQVYSDITARYDNLEEDSQLVAYLREVLERRERLDRLEEEEREATLAVETITADVSRPLDFLETSQFSHCLD